MASSSAFTMIWRSMPFSLQTCSMTRFRSGCIRAPSGVRVRRPRGPSEVVFDVGLLDGGERDDRPAGVRVVDRKRLGPRLHERAVELPAAADRISWSHADGRALCP